MNNIYLSNFFSNDLNILYIAYSFIIVIYGNTPNNLFFNNISEEEIKLINDKMLNSQKYTNLYRNNYELNEKILIHTIFFYQIILLKEKVKIMEFII